MSTILIVYYFACFFYQTFFLLCSLILCVCPWIVVVFLLFFSYCASYSAATQKKNFFSWRGARHKTIFFCKEKFFSFISTLVFFFVKHWIWITWLFFYLPFSFAEILLMSFYRVYNILDIRFSIKTLISYFTRLYICYPNKLFFNMNEWMNFLFTFYFRFSIKLLRDALLISMCTFLLSEKFDGYAMMAARRMINMAAFCRLLLFCFWFLLFSFWCVFAEFSYVRVTQSAAKYFE